MTEECNHKWEYIHIAKRKCTLCDKVEYLRYVPINDECTKFIPFWTEKEKVKVELNTFKVFVDNKQVYGRVK